MNGREVRECPAMEEVRGELREMSACLEKMLTELRCMNMTLKACPGVCPAMEQEGKENGVL